MSQLLGTNIIAPIVPGSTDDTFPTHIDLYGKGGYRAVSGINDLYDIPEERTSQGMMVQTYVDGKFWIYDETIGWFELPFRAGDPRIEADKIVYITGNQTISGNKSFVNYDETKFYGKVRSTTGLYRELVVTNEFKVFGRRENDAAYPCNGASWCSIPTEEAQDPDMPFDPSRNITGNNLGYSKLGRSTVRIGEGTVSGAEYSIFTVWVGRTGIGENGYGYESPLQSRSPYFSLNKVDSSFFYRMRGVESIQIQTENSNTNLNSEEQINQEQNLIDFDQIALSGVITIPTLNNGGDGGNIINPFGIRVLMLFTSSAPYIKLKDDYAKKIRLIKCVEKNSSWPNGFNLIWKPFPNHLYDREKFLPKYQLLSGTGLGLNGASDSKIISNETGAHRTSGFYNIKEKITWSLFFTGRIFGHRGDYDIDPWMGQSDTEVYPVLKRYWGASSKESLTGDEITGLLSGEYNFDPKQIDSSAKRLTPTGEYIYFAWPADSGFNNIDFFRNYSNSRSIQKVLNGYEFFVDGQRTNFNRTTITGIKNKVNYQEDYYLYRSPWTLDQSDPIKVEVRPEIF